MRRATQIRAAVGRLVAAGIDRSEAEYNVRILLEEAGKHAGKHSATAVFQQWLSQRASSREPMQYVLSSSGIPWPWGGVELLARKPVLCPRPETEEMLDILGTLASKAGGPTAADDGALSMLEVGTGTGAISIAACKGIRGIRPVTAIDYSPVAVQLAQENAVRASIQPPALTIALCRMEEYTPAQPVDILCSNPPYLPSKPEQPEVAHWEDPAALLGGDPFGLGFVMKMLRRVPTLVRPRGWILLEVHESHVHALASLLAGHDLKAEQMVLAPATGLGPARANDVSLSSSDMAVLLHCEGADSVRAHVAFVRGYYDSFGRPRFVLLQRKGWA